MERGYITFAAASSAPPMSSAGFLSSRAPSAGQSHCKGHRLCQLNSANCKMISQYDSNGRSGRSLNLKAINRCLSSHWDVSNYAAPSWPRRFEELDTTNMLLRQRIIFLGAQIDDTIADFVISRLLLVDSEDHKRTLGYSSTHLEVLSLLEPGFQELQEHKSILMCGLSGLIQLNQVIDVTTSLSKVADVDRNLGNEDSAIANFQEAVKLLELLTVSAEEAGLEQRRLSVLEFLNGQLGKK